jgi:hypothetical protein
MQFRTRTSTNRGKWSINASIFCLYICAGVVEQVNEQNFYNLVIVLARLAPQLAALAS